MNSRRIFAAVFATALAASRAAGQVPVADEILVSPQWLSQHLHDRDLVVLQNSMPADYAKEHIPGSRNVPPGGLENSMTGATMVMDKLPPAAALQEELEKLGISDSSSVVIAFGNSGVPQATRLLFLLTYAGLRHVTFLNGGLNGWKAAGFAVTEAVPSVTPGHLSAKANPALGVDYQYVLARHDAPGIKLIDARTAAYYNGPKQAGVGNGRAAGHIPSAVNMPYSTLFDDSLRILPRSKLEQLFRAAGVQPGDTVVAYCHVGIQATVVLLAARLLGNPVHLYVGSFHDWSDHNLPTEGGKP